MDKITKEQIDNAKVNPIFDGLSDEIKDPKGFKKIEKKLESIMRSDHKHTNIKQFIKCKRCEVKRNKKNEAIKELGFKDINQYQNWKKVMQIIVNKTNLELYVREGN